MSILQHSTCLCLSRRFAVLGFGLLVVAMAHSARAQEAADKDFKSLFSGPNLAGWQTTDNWRLDANGVLSLNPKSRRKRLIPDHESFLWSQGNHDNFILDLEFKIERGGSSGIFLRSTSTRSYLQIQIRDSHGQSGLGDNTTGAVVGVAAPKKNMSKPAGEWNHMLVHCDQNHLKVELNSEQVIDLDLAKSSKTSAIRTGRLGFENANNPVAFRNAKIKVLKSN
jgi:hypothetical protein